MDLKLKFILELAKARVQATKGKFSVSVAYSKPFTEGTTP